jgi:hypothetical protein
MLSIIYRRSTSKKKESTGVGGSARRSVFHVGSRRPTVHNLENLPPLVHVRTSLVHNSLFYSASFFCTKYEPTYQYLRRMLTIPRVSRQSVLAFQQRRSSNHPSILSTSHIHIPHPTSVIVASSSNCSRYFCLQSS